MTQIKFITILTTAFAISLTGCSGNSNSDLSTPSTQNKAASPAQNSPDNNNTNIPDPDPTSYDPTPLAVAQGWTGMTVFAYSAKTYVDSFTHFTTSRNGCGREAAGVLNHQDTNSLVVHLNQAVEGETARTPYCVDIPEIFPYMDDHVEVTMIQGNQTTKKTLYEVKENQICSNISDRKLSDQLLADVQSLILTADKQDVDYIECPWARRN